MIETQVEQFTGAWAALNHRRQSLPVTIEEIALKAVTVGGTPKGTAKQKSLRWGSIVGLIQSCVEIRPRDGVLVTTALFDAMETTEKGAASFRIGMALAAIMAEQTLGIDQLKHVSSRAGGPGRRADLYGLDRTGNWHVLEAKGRSYGVSTKLIAKGKGQSSETQVRDASGNVISPVTRSASFALLRSGKPIHVRLVDPPGKDGGGAKPVVLDTRQFLTEYYLPVAELLEFRGALPSGIGLVDALAIGTWLPGADAWLGLDNKVHQAAAASEWNLLTRALESLPSRWARPDDDAGRIAVGRDGHVLLLQQQDPNRFAAQPMPGGIDPIQPWVTRPEPVERT